MFSRFGVFLICLMSVSCSAHQVCESLVHPLTQMDPHHLEGGWALVASSINHQRSMEAVRVRDSINMHFSNSNDASNFSYTQIMRFNDQCNYDTSNMSVDGSAFTFVDSLFDLTGSFLNTSCPDCLVMRCDMKSSRSQSLAVYLLSKRREVDQKELEEFKAQLKCYGLPTPVVMDPTKELCPEQPEIQQPTDSSSTDCCSSHQVCESLVHPLTQMDPHHLEGGWALVASSINHQRSMEAVKLRDSINMHFSNSNDASYFSHTQIMRFNDQCKYDTSNMSVDGSAFTFVDSHFDLTGSFLNTSCPDCLVMRSDMKSSRRQVLAVHLLSKRREVDQKELEEFKAQLKCYGLPMPIVMDPTKELCPEQPESQQPTDSSSSTG